MDKHFSGIKGICRRAVCQTPQPPSEHAQIVADLKLTRERLEKAYARFEYECDEDLVESVIFEIESLKAQHSYLLRLARDEGVECAAISVFK